MTANHEHFEVGDLVQPTRNENGSPQTVAKNGTLYWTRVEGSFVRDEAVVISVEGTDKITCVDSNCCVFTFTCKSYDQNRIMKIT